MSLLSIRQVATRTGKARSTIYRDVAAGVFPAPRKDGTRTVWLECEIDAWEHALPKMGQCMGSSANDEKKPLKSAA